MNIDRDPWLDTRLIKTTLAREASNDVNRRKQALDPGTHFSVTLPTGAMCGSGFAGSDFNRLSAATGDA